MDRGPHFFPKAYADREAWALIEERCRAGVYIWNLRTGQMEWSRGFFRLAGFAEGEVVPTMDLSRGLLHPDDRITPQDWNAFIAEAVPFSRELRIIRRDGRMRWLNMQYEFLHDENGVARKLVGIAIDITEQQGRSELERRQADRFKEIVLAVAPIVWVAAPDGAMRNIRGWNRVTGRPDQAALGMGWLEAVHEDDRDATRDALVRARASARFFDWPFRLARASGGYHWVRPSAVPKVNREGEVVEWTGLLVDISRQCCEAAQLQELTGAQIRAARAILNWSVADLCSVSGLTSAVVRRLEAHDGVPPKAAAALQSVRDAAERAGVEFFFGPPGRLPGVRPADRPPSASI